MPPKLAESAIKNPLQSNLIEQLRNLGRFCDSPDTSLPCEKAHETLIALASMRVAEAVSAALKDDVRHKVDILQIGTRKMESMLGFSSLSDKLKEVILEITRQTLTILLEINT